MKKIKIDKTSEVLYYKKLNNGLELYVLPNINQKNFYITYSTKFGSINTEFKTTNDKEYKQVPNGIAHYLEHLMFNMKEGSAFIDQLLAMSAEDLEAYNQAYTEKMNAARKAGEDVYKADFEKVASDYEKEINTAFNTLPNQLKTLGEQSMKGFVDGLTKNTDYMSAGVKTFVKSMVDEFKKDLKIKSPSKVMFSIGEYTGEGFDQGLMSVIKSVQDTAGKIAGAVSSPLNDFGSNLGMVKSAVATGVNGVNSNSVVNNYNLVQNNTSPKPLSALETYQARRRQIAMMKAATMN
jgi:hypothetical protein